MIVVATISDAKILTEIALKSKAYWKYSADDLESWKPDLTVSEKMIDELFVYQFIFDDTAVGFYILNLPKEKTIELEMLFVLPDFIGKGIGKQLLVHAVEKAKFLEVESITLLSDPNAVSFYKSKGFLIIDKKQSSIAGRFLPIMKLDLSNNQ
ncbi:GNAT family N-acetyltransferase [Polaribacter vadi]|uniref:GNAT family N-acetyltransferase n=1 Tax=Polaribacter TaxID=52959 RepID=UPI001C08C706|nr:MULTISPECIES: GNAT family N-acetyltransferase [Polaribacter]MBU3010429.1 GNAT family N-acetyltransferase [Polaribacter vadi]MDO6740237.1 GNAT family N-acetyltransferase [Polaribacter sp. 1_MG-2023]